LRTRPSGRCAATANHGSKTASIAQRSGVTLVARESGLREFLEKCSMATCALRRAQPLFLRPENLFSEGGT
jgi:hypothetical protein